MSLRTRLARLEAAIPSQKTELIIIEDGQPTEAQEMLILCFEMLGTPYKTINFISAEPRPAPQVFTVTPKTIHDQLPPRVAPPAQPRMIQSRDGGWVLDKIQPPYFQN